jgi:hypothetical protein
MYTIGPAFVERNFPSINGLLCNMRRIFEDCLRSTDVLPESVLRKRPPFIYTSYSMNDIDEALQMPNGLSYLPPLSGGDGTRWNTNHSTMNFLKLYSQEYITYLAHDDVALIIIYDNLLPDDFLLKDDAQPDILYHPCMPERLNCRRLINVFYMQNSANYHTRVRIEVPVWANFGHIWMECLKGACSCNRIPISFMAQYKQLYSQLSATSTGLIKHVIRYNESKKMFIDAIIYIPFKDDNFIFATHLYCLWLANRIPIIDDNPLFKLFAGNLKEQFLMPYSPMKIIY